MEKENSIEKSSPSVSLVYADEHVQRLQADIEQTTRKLEVEKRRLHVVREIMLRSKEEYEYKRAKYGLNKPTNSDEVYKAHSKTRQLDVRLEKAYAKLNYTKANCEQVRSNVDKGRNTSLTLRSILERLYQEIHSSLLTEDELKSRVDETRLTLDQNATLLTKTRHMNEDQKLLHKSEITNKKSQIVQIEKDIKELIIQSQKQHLQDLHYKADEESLFNEKKMHSEIIHVIFSNAILKKKIDQHRNHIEGINQALSVIMKETGANDMQEIVHILTEQEDINYSAVAYLNLLAEEKKRLISRNNDLREMIALTAGEEEKEEERRENAVKELSESIRISTEGLAGQLSDLRQTEADLKFVGMTMVGLCCDLLRLWVDEGMGGDVASRLRNNLFFQRESAEILASTGGSLEEDGGLFVGVKEYKERMEMLMRRRQTNQFNANDVVFLFEFVDKFIFSHKGYVKELEHLLSSPALPAEEREKGEEGEEGEEREEREKGEEREEREESEGEKREEEEGEEGRDRQEEEKMYTITVNPLGETEGEKEEKGEGIGKVELGEVREEREDAPVIHNRIEGEISERNSQNSVEERPTSVQREAPATQGEEVTQGEGAIDELAKKGMEEISQVVSNQEGESA